MAWVLCALSLTKSLPLFIFPPIMYKLHGLVSIEKYAFGLDHGGCSRPDLGHFLRHAPGMVEVQVGRWRNHPSRDDRDSDHVCTT